MRRPLIHHTSPARSGGPERKKPTPTAPPPPPRWRNALILVGVLLTVWLLYNNLSNTTKPIDLSYSEFVTKVESNQVKSVEIDANGGVTGTLKDGTEFESQLVTAVPDNQLVPLLEAHDVEIAAQPGTATSILSVILSFAPFLILIGIYLWIGRRAQRAMAGGIGGIGGGQGQGGHNRRPPPPLAPRRRGQGGQPGGGGGGGLLQEPPPPP